MEQTNNEHRDFLYYVVKQQDKGDLNKDEVIVNGALFIIAGTGTTASLLTGLFNLLTRAENKHILDNLTKEIRDNFKSDAYLNFQALNALAYLSAVIDEGLRKFPSAPIGFTRSVLAGSDAVCNEYLPGGTTVSRWLDRNGASTNRDGDKVTATIMEMRLIIGKLLWWNDVEGVEGNDVWDPRDDYARMKVYTNWIKPRLKVRLSPRNDI
ncbi:cytochrome P450 [Setomelanomma holmii]|uniref:Cytochrome P450 n=1 Tax=Setomelanomma holmii TaxID=210430 RepID=A0A9P4H2R8_9PLEO|nr:cytochrome P450 [Setomelanomma holmii]